MSLWQTINKMRKLFLLFMLLLAFSNLKAQDLDCTVTINDSQIAGSNKQVFKTLQKSITEFINKTEWTGRETEPHERIKCAFTIIVTTRQNNNFKASIQVQSSRPVFNSTYLSPVLNIRDNDFSFRYNEFDPLIYNPNSFDSNLVSTLVFYVNIILGIDADTFSEFGGEKSLKEAQNIALQAQQSGLAAWSNRVATQNRFQLIDNLLSAKLKGYRKAMYNYHRKGLDIFSSKPKDAKQIMEDTVISFENLYNKVLGNHIIRLFFDAKADEIVNLYEDNTQTKNKQKLISTVQRISTNNNSKWKSLN